MGKRKLRAIKAPDDVKIKLLDWKEFFSAKIASEGLASQEYSDNITSLLCNLVETHLQCTDCNRVLPDDSFFNQRVHVSRRCKSLLCKECWKLNYRSNSNKLNKGNL